MHRQRELPFEHVFLFRRWQFTPDEQICDIFKLLGPDKLGDSVLSVMNAALSAIASDSKSQCLPHFLACRQVYNRVVDLHKSDFGRCHSGVLIPRIKYAKTPFDFVGFGFGVRARSDLLELSCFYRVTTDGYLITVAGPGVCNIEKARGRRWGGKPPERLWEILRKDR